MYANKDLCTYSVHFISLHKGQKTEYTGEMVHNVEFGGGLVVSFLSLFRIKNTRKHVLKWIKLYVCLL